MPMNRKIGTISKKFFRPYEGIFSKASPGPTYIEKEVTGNGYINLTNAVANHLMELKAYGGTEQPAKTYIDSVTAEGKCVQASTPTPTTPVDIACNNGTIKFSKNMANVNSQTALVGYYISTAGVVTADTYNRMYQEFIPCKPNTTYTLSMSSSVYFVTISEYSTAEDSGFVIRKAGSSGSNTKLTITTGANTNYLRFGANLDRTSVTLEEVLAINWQLEIGDTPTTYHEYVEGGIYIDGTTETITDSSGLTATCQDLLSVGNYKDTQEILTGLVTRNVGILVLDGTENWTASVTYIGSCYLTLSQITAGPYYPIYVTHFVGKTSEGSYGVGNALYNGRNLSLWLSNETTADTLKSWLAEQYTAGTPVILVYPLTTATTNTVTGQQLNIAPVTATGSVSDLVATAVTSVHTTPTPAQPLDINCNNGVIKYGQYGKNLFDKNTASLGDIATNGDYTSRTYRVVSDYIPVRYGQTLVGSGTLLDTNGDDYNANVIKAFYKADKSYITGSRGSVTGNKFTINDNECAYVRIVFFNTSLTAGKTVSIENSTLQLEEGETPTSYEPYHFGIHTDGTVETIGVNLLDLSNVDNGHYYNPTGEYISLEVARLSNFVSVKAGDTISVTTEILSGSTGLNIRYNFFDTSKQWLSQSAYTLTRTEGKHTEQVTAQQDGYFAFSGNYTGSGTLLNWDTVVIMNNEKNVTAEMLLKVGDYVDEQEILTGNIARKVGIKVLDGTENWTKGASSYTFNYYYGGDTDLDSNAENELVCNQFAVGTRNIPSVGKICVRQSRNGFLIAPNDQTINTAEKFKQWLADQYNAGTPVIVVYPLNTPTTESVAGQTMHIPAGNSTIEITQASIDNLGLYAKYKATT